MKRLLLLAVGVLLLGGLIQVDLNAQGNIDWEELWINSPPPPNQTNHPNAWMIPQRSFTGLAYDKWNDVVYIVNPHTTVQGQIFWQTPRIHIWNAMTGTVADHVGRSADPTVRGAGGEMPVPIDSIVPGVFYRSYSQNTYSIYKIDLDDQGRIYTGNLVVPIWGICILLPSGQCDPVYLAQGGFRVWRWDGPAATPHQMYQTLNPTQTTIGSLNNSEMTYSRYGDAFDVIGKQGLYDPPGPDPPYVVDSVRIYVSGGSWPTQPVWNKEVQVIVPDYRPMNQRVDRDDAGGGKYSFKLGVRLVNSNDGLASHGLAATGMQDVGDVWMDSNPRITTAALQVYDKNAPTPQTYNQQATGNRSLSTSLTGQSGPIRYFELKEFGRKFLVLADGFPTNPTDPTQPNNNTKARVLDVTTPGADFKFWSDTPPVGSKVLNNNSSVNNFIADVDYKLVYFTPAEKPDEPGLHLVAFVLMSNNGIGAFLSRKAFPVELTTLRATLNGDVVDLTWNVANETNNHGFEVQRSYDGGNNWEVAGFVAGRGTTTEPFDYSFSDPVSSTFKNVGAAKYRLRQIDTDGSESLSPIVDVFYSGAPSSISLYQNYPNPFNPSTTISYQTGEAGHVQIEIFNALGESVGTIVDEYKEAGVHQQVLNAQDLPSGTYIYQLNVNGQLLQKKMTVMK